MTSNLYLTKGSQSSWDHCSYIKYVNKLEAGELRDPFQHQREKEVGEPKMQNIL